MFRLFGFFFAIIFIFGFLMGYLYGRVTEMNWHDEWLKKILDE